MGESLAAGAGPEELADAVAEEFADCRQRGLDWLDRSTSTLRPVRADALQRLAADYVAARRLSAVGRIAEIKILLQNGISELALQGHVSDANLLRDLFFGESTDGPIKSPTDLLKAAQKKIGDSDTRFRERRANLMKSFARFLIGFVDGASAEPDAVAEDVAPEQRQQLVTTGYVGDTEHFIRLLTRAVNVTIVGITNERLAGMLQGALKRKRTDGRPDAFWDSLRIVFLKRNLLHAVNDERERIEDPGEALRQRRLEAAWGRSSVQHLLSASRSTRWSLHECPFMPTLSAPC